MIVSDVHRYVYIGIPRTGSKSMNHWLCEYFDGRNCGGHHDYLVPEEYRHYLVFTLVRNPYDRAVSGHFGVVWSEAVPLASEQAAREQKELEMCETVQDRLRRFRAFMKAREKQRQRPWPTQSPAPLEERIRAAVAASQGEGSGISQKRLVDKAGVKLALYFERLPECLLALPFVDPDNVPPFPHHPEAGIRPPGNFFDFFADTDEEQVVWADGQEDFVAFGYRRFDTGLPSDRPSALRVK